MGYSEPVPGQKSICLQRAHATLVHRMVGLAAVTWCGVTCNWRFATGASVRSVEEGGGGVMTYRASFLVLLYIYI